MFASNKIKEEYWVNLSVSEKDIEFIYDLLLEKEIPLSTEILIKSLINYRIGQEKDNSEKQFHGKNSIYLPKDEYHIGDKLVFPSLDMNIGEVQEIRDGFNPDYENLKIIQVKFESGESKVFASNIQNHPLNHILDIPEDDPNYDSDLVYDQHKQYLSDCLETSLTSNEDLVNIAGSWFPRSLLIDVHVGHLNLAEAILEEANGGPIETIQLMDQVELKANADTKLLEFSFNLALQEDKRFDEVGPAGETLWFLNAMEPDSVKKVPMYLRYGEKSIDHNPLTEYLELLEKNIYDELDAWDSHGDENNRIIISLSYPHWRSGTLPLSSTLKKMFPTAYEAPRVKFTFIDERENEQFPGWVVRQHKYVYGLKDWYQKNSLMPGSLVIVEKGKTPGEILIHFEKSRQNKEWIKTVLIGSDQAVVFAMLKHPISANYNERMAIFVTDTDALDEIWDKKVYQKEPIEKTILRITRELSKLNPQGHVHAQELYAAINVVRRCPPSMVVHHLLNAPTVEYLGDLYFRFIEKET
jgi:hypothetical protein